LVSNLLVPTRKILPVQTINVLTQGRNVNNH